MITNLKTKNKNIINLDNSKSELKFKNILRYERLRSDRDGQVFSLIILFLKSKFNYDELLERLYMHLRAIDIVGKINDYSLGILLPLVDNKEAVSITEKLIKFPDIKLHVYSSKTYTYPNQWININNDDENLFNINLIHLLNQDKVIIHKNYLNNKNFKDEILSATVIKVPFWKRLFDITVSSISLFLLSPIFLFVGLFIKLASPGPVIFIQKRIGYKGKIFNFYKFRTMHIKKDSEETHKEHVTNLIQSDKPMIKLDKKNDCRIIKGGKILRKTCIDELPQLFNVLKGDMSLVGPRPCVPYEEKEFLQWHKNRFDLLPGMTGLWQVSGKNKLTFKQMIRLDIKYVNNLSFFLDLKILFLTIPTVVGLVFDKVLKNKVNRMKNNKVRTLFQNKYS